MVAEAHFTVNSRYSQVDNQEQPSHLFYGYAIVFTATAKEHFQPCVSIAEMD
ncbi:hypothetical protein STEG23_001058, partial [Scotinomys teguina]